MLILKITKMFFDHLRDCINTCMNCQSVQLCYLARMNWACNRFSVKEHYVIRTHYTSRGFTSRHFSVHVRALLCVSQILSMFVVVSSLRSVVLLCLNFNFIAAPIVELQLQPSVVVIILLFNNVLFCSYNYDFVKERNGRPEP